MNTLRPLHRFMWPLGVLLFAIAVFAQSVTVVVSGPNRVAVGCEIQLSASLVPSYGSPTFTWSSSDPSIATVTGSGLVKGTKPGTVTITAKDQAGHQGSKAVTVEIGTPFIFDPTKVTINICNPGKENYVVHIIPTFCAKIGTLKWSIASGDDIAHIIGPNDQSDVTVKAKKGSASIGDVVLQVVHTLLGSSKSTTLAITVAEPKTLTRDPLQFVYKEIELIPGSGIVFETIIGVKTFIGTLHDQFGRPMKNVPFSEKVKINMQASVPHLFRPIVQTGSGTTNSSGQYTDVYIVSMLGKAPSNTRVVVDQSVNFCGYKGSHTILLTSTGVTDGYPITLVKP